ncbi:transposase [Methanoregula sp.]|uniref:transposase n=1 Tax=Methanoregula sp. TaxID=2052170 RepID=UPI003C76BD7E
MAFEITNKQNSDDEVFLTLLNQAQSVVQTGSITEVLADGAYEKKENFNQLEKNHIDSGIKFRDNTSPKSGNPLSGLNEHVKKENRVSGPVQKIMISVGLLKAFFSSV